MKETAKYDVFDLVKLLLSFGVMALHCGFDKSVPYLRIAVPLFFVFSSFLFFRGNADSSALKKYVLRNLQLYAVWFVALIPFTVIARKDWFLNGLSEGCFIFIRELFFGSTFKGSWYVSASILAVPIVYALSKKIGDVCTLVLSALAYGLCSMVSNYEVWTCTSPVSVLYDISQIGFGGIEQSFFMALLWISIGKVFAQKEREHHAAGKRYTKVLLLAATGLSIVALTAEHRFIQKRIGIPNDNSCYLALVPLVIFVFCLLLELKTVRIKGHRYMRVCSTLNYFLHCAVIVCISWILRLCGMPSNDLVRFFIVGICTMIISTAIYWLSGLSKWKWLKKLY